MIWKLSCGYLYVRFLYSRRYSSISKDQKRVLINEEIRDKELRVVDADGNQLGIMSRNEALARAEKAELDLVCIAPKANPPVCKILDYGKYMYELHKKEKEAKKNQKMTQVKEIRLSTFIEEHDVKIKAKNAAKFLNDGDRVKVSLRFRGREAAYKDKGLQVMETFAAELEDIATIDKKPTQEGRNLNMVLAPRANDTRRKENG